ncbi:hypothetical protein TrST_g3083 [Triparma strigata]|uniref:sn-1-specific diacylglycerol lipase n=1 Tax=Triparma strigata TaxID=1606541 RepID=A0A9W7AQT4_9STRA|nr:hypothetical protein TrST_g3083 [Triparma strigata]
MGHLAIGYFSAKVSAFCFVLCVILVLCVCSASPRRELATVFADMPPKIVAQNLAFFGSAYNSSRLDATLAKAPRRVVEGVERAVIKVQGLGSEMRNSTRPMQILLIEKLLTPVSDQACSTILTLFSTLSSLNATSLTLPQLSALSSLQPPLPSVAPTEIPPGLKADICHYVLHCSSSYGWMGRLFFKKRLTLTLRKIISLQTSIPPSDIILTRRSSPLTPSFYIALDRFRSEIVICIRGTMSLNDIFTDLTISQSKEGPEEGTGHQGIYTAAERVFNVSEDVVKRLKEEHPDYRLVLTGHSLGAGCAFYLSGMFKGEGYHPRTFCYGVPCVEVEEGRFRKWFDGSGSGSGDVVSVIINGDPFSRLSLGHVKDVVRSCKFIAGKGGAVEDVEWRELRRKMNHRKLYPPGRIIEVDDRADDVVVGEVQKGRYDCIRLGKESFDLRWHLPERYERTLRRWKKG